MEKAILNNIELYRFVVAIILMASKCNSCSVPDCDGGSDIKLLKSLFPRNHYLLLSSRAKGILQRLLSLFVILLCTCFPARYRATYSDVVKRFRDLKTH